MIQPRDGFAAEYFVKHDQEDELRALADDLAFVCPLVDGRLKDLAEGKSEHG